MSKLLAGTKVRVTNIYGTTVGTLRKDAHVGAYGLVELVVDGKPFRTEGRVEYWSETEGSTK